MSKSLTSVFHQHCPPKGNPFLYGHGLITKVLHHLDCFRDETVVQQNQKAVLSFTSPGFQTACMSFLATMIVDAGPMGRTRCDDTSYESEQASKT